MKIWLDDLREAPEGYILCRSVNEAKRLIEENEKLIFSEISISNDISVPFVQ